MIDVRRSLGLDAVALVIGRAPFRRLDRLNNVASVAFGGLLTWFCRNGFLNRHDVVPLEVKRKHLACRVMVPGVFSYPSALAF